jgi:SAM-dependent methyltransferase
MAGLLELEGEVFSAYHLEVAGWLHQLSDGLDVRRVVDLGSGPGVGTLTLATAFAGADVVAVDLSAELLTRVRGKAVGAGLANRIFTVQADLDQGLPHVGSPDLAWASLSLHHLSDPDRLLRDLRSSLNPGGLVAVAELASPLRLLPDDLGVGRPGLEDRVDQVTAPRHAELLPHLNDDWPSG